jgi:AcrR family transcriptional regulator
MASTRARIIDATMALYAERGISATTLREIGERADVAPGTLRNHFPTRDDLEIAVVERVRADVPLPDRSIFDGADDLGERLRRLVEAGGRFLEQAEHLYRMWRREPLLTGPWLAAGADYGRRWDELFREALGPLADDPESNAVIRAILDPGFFATIRSGRRTSDAAAALVASLVTPWFVARQRAERQGAEIVTQEGTSG